MSKNPGKKFEEDFVRSIPERCDVTRLKDGGGWSNATNMRFTSNNPCDFIVFSESEFGTSEGTMYKLELKSVKGKSLPFGNTKDHQRISLEVSQSKGVWAGFIVNFRDTNETFAIRTSNIAAFMAITDRKSIPLSWFRDNGKLIKQTLIRVRYKYGLEWL